MAAVAELVGSFLNRLRGDPSIETGVGRQARRLLEKKVEELNQPKESMTTEIVGGKSQLGLIWRLARSSKNYIPGFCKAVVVREVSPTEVAVSWADTAGGEKIKWVGAIVYDPYDNNLKHVEFLGEDFSRIPKGHQRTIEKALNIAMGHAGDCSEGKIREVL